jgi:putative salt-induced outer membrane protein
VGDGTGWDDVTLSPGESARQRTEGLICGAPSTRSLMPHRSLLPLALLVIALAAPRALRAQDPPTVVNKLTADLGFVQTSGNTQVTTMNVGEKFTQQRNRWTFAQSFAMVYGKQRDTVNTENLRTALRADYKVDRVVSFFTGVGFDRNRFAGIAQRFEEQIGLQARVLAATADTISLEGGGSMTQQIPVNGVQQNFPSARGAMSWRHAFTAATYFHQNLEYVPNLSEHEDWRVNTESTIVAPLSARIGLKVSYVVRYDNLPEPGFQELDKLFTTGIQLTFD